VTEHRIFLHKKVIEDFLSLFYLFSDSTNSRKMSTKISARTLGSTSVSTPLARGIQVALGIGLTVSIIYVLKLRKQYKQIESPSKSSVKSETIPYDDRVHIPRWLGANFGTSPSPQLLPQFSHLVSIMHQLLMNHLHLDHELYLMMLKAMCLACL
jgi:hypothetical protein